MVTTIKPPHVYLLPHVRIHKAFSHGFSQLIFIDNQYMLPNFREEKMEILRHKGKNQGPTISVCRDTSFTSVILRIYVIVT
jgi:hypothetical protein